jgi:hypothetical protein
VITISRKRANADSNKNMLAALLLQCSALQSGGAAQTIVRCALSREPPASTVLSALEEIESCPLGLPVARDDLAGHQWELIFSSAAANVPFIDGYMPNREILTWDLDAQRLELEIETLPLIPKISVVGEQLELDAAAQVLSYAVGQKPKSTWQLLFFEPTEGVIAARSSKTGLNVIRRIEQ